MLVLSRKVGEEIVIGDTIRIKVVAVQNNQIRLGLTAPKDVSIYRQELVEPRCRVTAEEPGGPQPPGTGSEQPGGD